MSIKHTGESGYLILELQGDFRGGEDNFAQLRSKGHQALAECPFLVIDLAHVSFLDSQTLGLLVELMRLAHTRAGELYLANVSARVRRWFELSGLDRIFEFIPEGRRPPGPEPVPPPEERREMLDSVDIEVMVSELSEALGDADESGAPCQPAPEQERLANEIRKLLDARPPESD